MNAKHILFLVLLLARLASAQSVNHGPTEFSFKIITWGPSGQTWMEITYKDGMLSKLVNDNQPRKDDQTIDTTPTAAQWLAFRKTLDEIGVWKWKNKYDVGYVRPPGIRAGSSFDLVLKFPGRKIKISGVVKEPESFDRFKAAVDKLFAN